MQSKIVVTGANGQLGCEIRELHSSSENIFYFTDIETLDLTSKLDTNSYLSKISPDYIINCAAYTAVDKAESDKEMAQKVNADVPGILADYARDNGIRIVQISTDYVYPGTSSKPLTEEDPTGPESVYGQTKLHGEENILKNEKSLVIRTSWLYSSYGTNFVKNMVRYMGERDELGIVNDQVGCPTYARDLAKVILKVTDGSQESEALFSRGIYHYSNEGSASWYDLTMKIKQVVGAPCTVNPIATKDYPLPAPRPAYSVMSKEKIKKALRIDIPHWEDSLTECLQKLSGLGGIPKFKREEQ